MNVELVILGSSSIKFPHCKRIKSSAAVGAPATKCASSSKLPAKGEIVAGVLAHSGAGAPYSPQRDCRLLEIRVA